MTIAPRKEDHVCVSTACLDLSEIAAMVADPRAGAVSTFSGTTRDNHFGKKVVRLEYEGYVPMAELELKKICAQVRARWNVLRIALVHRLGVTAVGEASVIIAVSSVHRKDSLEAVEFAINTLKATVPIWKLEVYEGDSRVWKENAEWGPGGGCCRKMVPMDAGNIQAAAAAAAAAAAVTEGHAPAQVGTSRTNSASSTTSTTSTTCSASSSTTAGIANGTTANGSGSDSGGGCCGSHA